jgi:SAM-dependent methyltransferase
MDVLSYVRGSLPRPPARVLEVGAGDGELARAMSEAGYDVVAIDPASTVSWVRPVPLIELAEPAASFDAAVACLSLHHVQPLGESCSRLAEALRPAAALVVDEFDIDRFDDRAARWWLDRRLSPHDHDGNDPASVIERLRPHVQPLADVFAALVPWFDIGPPTRGTYLHRWDLPPGTERDEEDAIASGAIQATGVRFVATRRAE